jgi:hypothetical protein
VSLPGAEIVKRALAGAKLARNGSDDGRTLQLARCIGRSICRLGNDIVDWLYLDQRSQQRNAREHHSLGSGTLVRMPGDKFGVLTAAHVLDDLPDTGKLGYLTFNRQDSFQQAKIDAGLTKKVYAPGWVSGAVVPDLI